MHINTKMYDTLMQMGRWFGYRPHYDDLCQILINDDAVDWYEYISEAAEELKQFALTTAAINCWRGDFITIEMQNRQDAAILFGT